MADSLTCPICGKQFVQRIRPDRKPQQFCSRQCWAKRRIELSRSRVYEWISLYVVEGWSLQKIATKYGVHSSLILRTLRNAGIKTRTAGRYKNKQVTFKTGYKLIEVSGHPRAFDGCKMFEHIVVAEKMLGRYLLPGEYVHHIDLNKLNNDESNLVVLTRREHASHHRQINSLLTELIQRGSVIYDRNTNTYRCA